MALALKAATGHDAAVDSLEMVMDATPGTGGDAYQAGLETEMARVVAARFPTVASLVLQAAMETVDGVTFPSLRVTLLTDDHVDVSDADENAANEMLDQADWFHLYERTFGPDLADTGDERAVPVRPAATPALDCKRRSRAAKALASLGDVGVATGYRVVDDGRYDLLPSEVRDDARTLVADLAATDTPAAPAAVLVALTSMKAGTALDPSGNLLFRADSGLWWAAAGGRWDAVKPLVSGGWAPTSVQPDCTDPVRVAKALLRATTGR